MANVVRKMYRYLSASANRKIDEMADPRVQIEQAIDEARKQHQALRQNAAAVLGRRRQLEMHMARQIDEVRNVRESAIQALRLADEARLAGDAANADRHDQDAQMLAAQLVTVESSLEEMKSLHVQASAAAEQAKRAVEDNEVRVREMLDERIRLLTQLEHTAMQEQVTKALESRSPLVPQGDVPTLAEVRDKIEKRQALAVGRQELASQGMEARMLEMRRTMLNARALDRLADLRRELPPAAAPAPTDLPKAGTGAGPALPAGAQPTALTKGGSAGGAPAVPDAPGASGSPGTSGSGSEPPGTSGSPGSPGAAASDSPPPGDRA